MNLLLFTDADRTAADTIELRDGRLRHLRQVQRAAVGDCLRVGELGGRMGTGEVIELSGARAVLRVTLDRPPPDRLPLTLVLALPRPKMLRRILRSVAEFGVRELHLLNSYRVQKSYWQSPLLEPQALRTYLLAGLEQACDTILPAVHCHRRFRPWLEDELPALLAGRDAWLGHTGDCPPCPAELERESLLVIGPEGGFIPWEVDRLTDAGCRPVSLGPRTLRVETAVAGFLGRLT